jgi:hypothetical protein
MAVAPRRTITDDLLEVSVRIKREAGVTHAQIQEVIDKFASREQWEERTGGIGYPLVEDIPQERRGEFMAALSELMPESDRGRPQKGESRYLSAAHIWPSRIE